VAALDLRDIIVSGAVEGFYSASTGTAIGTAVWSFPLGIDLAEAPTAATRPPDDALRRRLSEPRRLHTNGICGSLSAHFVNVPAALEARWYGIEPGLVPEVSGGSAGSGHAVTEAYGSSCWPGALRQ
jgi:hypothetical protein